MHTVIIGSGFAGITFADKFRTLNPDASITVITRENEGFYSRPLLSHGFSKEDIERSIILKSFEAIRQKGIEVLTETDVEKIDRRQKTLSISCGTKKLNQRYDTLILATGSSAFIPEALKIEPRHFHLFNSLTDLKRLRALRYTFLEQGKAMRWAIVGGGLIGCEVASDLAVANDRISLFHVGDRLMENQLTDHDSTKLLDVLVNHGVSVFFRQSVSSITKQKDSVIVHCENGGSFDAVILACGFQARKELASAAGLSVGRGIKVNSFLQTDDLNIYAIGDVAELPNGKLYPFILPIRSQAQWLAEFLIDEDIQPWLPPEFKPKPKVHGFSADNPRSF